MHCILLKILADLPGLWHWRVGIFPGFCSSGRHDRPRCASAPGRGQQCTAVEPALRPSGPVSFALEFENSAVSGFLERRPDQLQSNCTHHDLLLPLVVSDKAEAETAGGAGGERAAAEQDQLLSCYAVAPAASQQCHQFLPCHTNCKTPPTDSPDWSPPGFPVKLSIFFFEQCLWSDLRTDLCPAANMCSAQRHTCWLPCKWDPQFVTNKQDGNIGEAVFLTKMTIQENVVRTLRRSEMVGQSEILNENEALLECDLDFHDGVHG